MEGLVSQKGDLLLELAAYGNIQKYRVCMGEKTGIL